MRVFVDYHHHALYYSLHLLFEKRLGWELYSPTGLDWFFNGYWRYSSNEDTVKQFLDIPSDAVEENGVYYIPTFEGTQSFVRKAVTYQKFMSMDWDFIIASVYNHEKPYYELAKLKNAVFIRQMGNPVEKYDLEICRNILNSTKNPVPPNINQVYYHPEFNIENDYYYTPPENHKLIKNFMNCLPDSIDAPLWYKYEQALPEYTFKMHGILGRDGLLLSDKMPEAMRDAGWIWHLKSQGDGYGFVVHQAAAIGRPLIIKKNYYRNQSAEPLFTDGVTCIDLSSHSFEDNIRLIRYWSQPENHKTMSQNIYNRFREVVDFDKELNGIKRFLDDSMRTKTY